MTAAAAEIQVRHLRQVLLWPLRLMPAGGADHTHLRLSDFLDVLSDERLTGWTKLKALLAVWRPGRD